MAGDQAMVVTASGSLGVLQQFTADREVLRHAVDRLRPQSRSFRPYARPRRPAHHGLPGGADRARRPRGPEHGGGGDHGHRAHGPAEQQHRTGVNEQRVRTMARQIVASTAHVTSLTLSALERLVDGLRPVRGRKVVAFFSGGFFLGPERETETARPAGDRGRGRALRRRLLHDRRAGPHLHRRHRRRPHGRRAPTSAGRGPGGPTATPGTRARIELRGVDAARDGLSALALDTGGLAFFDHNELAGAAAARARGQRRLLPPGLRAAGVPAGRPLPQDRGPRPRPSRPEGARGERLLRAGQGARRRGPRPRPAREDASRLLRSALDSPYPLRDLPLDLAADFVRTTRATW